MPGSRKKIITLGSSIALILIFLHLIGVYIYSGGHYEGVRGGSISIGIVDNVPNAMNPFQYGINHNSDLLYRFLFRGLIKYNISTGIYQGDLTSCDISNLSKVTCIMRDDAVWSDGTRVKSEDIIATIEEFKNSAPQEEMKGFLSSVKVIKTTDGIEIQSTQKSQHMIELLSYPIVKSDVITLINSGTINEKNYITSGPYILGESALDKEYGFNRITLLRNEKYSQSTWLDKIHFKFFKDLSSLERSAETLTMVIPPAKNEKIDIGPRFKEYLYTNYEYFSVFLNTNTLNRLLRNSIHWQIGTSFSGNIAEDHKRTDTIFPSGGALLPTGAMKAFPDILRDLGYKKKTEILAKAEQISTLVSGELVIPPVKYWTNKSNASILFVEELPEEIIFTGKVPANTETVTINDYTLREFIPGNTIFAYKVSQLMGSLKEGKNTYNLSLKLSNGKTETETLTVYASNNSGTIAEYKKQLQDEYSATQNTPALIAARERTKQEKINQIRELQDEYYFNNKNEIFVIKIGYIVGPQSTEVYAKRIDEALKLLGIKTELIAYTAKDIQNIISTGEKKYDILVIGISVEGSLASIGKLFSNTDAKNSKLNFSNIESKTLENQFAELRATTNVDKISQIEESISKIMNTESFFVPISSPYHRIWVDRNVKGIPKIEVIPDIAAFVDVFVGTSIKENYIRNTKDKKYIWVFQMDSIAIISNFYEGKYRIISMGNGNQISFPKKLNFIPSFMGMLWLFVILFYQLTFSYIYIFDQKDEVLDVLSRFMHTDYFGETIVILCIIFILYMLLEPIATGGLIEMMHSYKQHHGEKNRRGWQGFFDGLRHFLPIFEAHNLTAIFRPLSILTFYILLLRIFGKEYIVPITSIMGIYLFFAFCINICFSYSKFFIIFEHKGAIESLSASTGLALRNIGITGKLYFTMILLYFRTIFVAIIFLVIPFLISSFLAFLPTIIGLKLFFLIIFLIISIVLFIFIVHLNSTLEIFVEATWYEAYMLCKEEEKGGHHEDHGHHGEHGEHHDDGHGHDTHHEDHGHHH